MEIKSVSECLENYYCGCASYTSAVHEPKKDQITGDALDTLSDFIKWCFKKEKINEYKKS